VWGKQKTNRRKVFYLLGLLKKEQTTKLVKRGNINMKKITKRPSKQPTTKRAIKKQQLVQLWKDTRGHISDMCRAVGVTRKTFYSWLKKDPKFNRAIQDAEAELNDDVHRALIQCIADGKESSIHFYLKKRHPKYKNTNIGVDPKVKRRIVAEEFFK